VADKKRKDKMLVFSLSEKESKGRQKRNKISKKGDEEVESMKMNQNNTLKLEENCTREKTCDHRSR
jgi:hypothetical protein